MIILTNLNEEQYYDNPPKITKTLFKLLIMLICVYLSIFTVMYYSNKTEKNNENKDNTSNKGANQNIDNSKLTKIAFEKDNNVYIYDELSRQIKSFGDNLKSKDLLELSPDKTKIVFMYFNEGKPITLLM